MALQTGENEQALRKILDLTRWIAIASLLIHFYAKGYNWFREIGWEHAFTDRIMLMLHRTGLFNSMLTSKMLALGFLLISLMGAKGKKEDRITYQKPIAYILIGLLLYFFSDVAFQIPLAYELRLYGYMLLASCGFLTFLMGGTWMTRVISAKILQSDIDRKSVV